MGSADVELEEVIPWGRSFHEYCRMFDLQPDSLPGSILDCAGGPSSFCAEATRRGNEVVAVDPIYQFSADAIRERLRDVTPRILSMMQEHPDRFVLDQFDTPEEVVEGRHESMEVFLDDLPRGRKEGRYRVGSLLEMEFDDNEFDLALSSHFLFLYDETLSDRFHRRAVREVLRVAEEFRVFPLTNMNAEPSSHLPPVTEELSENGHKLEVHEVDYEFQKGANQMLVIR